MPKRMEREEDQQKGQQHHRLGAGAAGPEERRAIVVGASLAGLLAARVLQEYYDEVILFERDQPGEAAAIRKGTPHAIHPHGLLARGREAIEHLFPGFTEAMLARGATSGDIGLRAAVRYEGRSLARSPLGVKGLTAGRLAIEAEIRCRVRALARCKLVGGVDVVEPIHREGRVTGVRWRAGDGTEPLTETAAALVVDCSGRGSRSPRWLAGWGYRRVPEETIEIDLAYTSAYFRRDDPHPEIPVIIGTASPEMPWPSVLLAQEPDADGTPRWVAGVGGYGGDHVALDRDAIAQRARASGNPEIAALAEHGVLLGDVIRYRMPSSIRRRYEAMKHFPLGFLIMGDALASFNPVYGQGMAVVACEALTLKAMLLQQREQEHELVAQRFFAECARIIDTPWRLAAGADLSLPVVRGPRPLSARLINPYLRRLRRLATGDPVLAGAFIRVMHLLEPPRSLLAPRMIWRVLRGRLTASNSAPPVVAARR